MFIEMPLRVVLQQHLSKVGSPSSEHRINETEMILQENQHVKVEIYGRAVEQIGGSLCMGCPKRGFDDYSFARNRSENCRR